MLTSNSYQIDREHLIENLMKQVRETTSNLNFNTILYHKEIK